MRKKDEIKLDALSMIDDEIIEKNTQKRIKLMNKKRRPRWIIPSSVAAAIVVCILVPILIFMFAKQVPIYEGMTVSNYKNDSTAENLVPENDRYRFDFLSNTNNGNGNGNGNNGNHYGHDKKPIDDIVEEDTSISLEIPEQHMYYANQGQDIYITVHISNPDSFEILSFTLNGKKYSSYMFEQGSDMENLILKVNAGNEPGIREYTIDAIKYVDGTEIKDVDMRGERTVKVGIYSAGIQPTVQITDEIVGINEISFKAYLADSYKLIERSDGKVFAGVYSEDKLIAYKEIEAGENSVSFDGLDTYTSYRYGVVAYYDALDGNQMDVHTLYEKDFTTQSVVAPNNVQIDKTSISFGLTFSEMFTSKKLTSLTLYHGEDKVKGFDVSGDLTTKTFTATELLSNNTYKIVIAYENKGETEQVEFIVKTEAKSEPTFTFGDVSADTNTINGTYYQTNPDNTLVSYNVELFNGNELVEENADKSVAFDSLDYYTNYTVKITYTYDLNDGKGIHKNTIAEDIKTLPFIEVLSAEVRNTFAVSIGDTIYLQAEIINPAGITIAEVIVNGNKYAVSAASTAQRIFVEMKCDESFGGGEVDIAIEQIIAKDDDVTYNVTMQDKKYATLLINGMVEILSMEFVDNNYEPASWFFPDEERYLKLTVNNPTGYELKQVSLSFWDANIVIKQEEIIKVSDAEYIIDYSKIGYADIAEVTVYATFENSYASKTVGLENVFLKCVFLDSNKIKYISSRSDMIDLLTGMDVSGYYELTADIDLSGVEWLPKDFYGVLNGNGYSIKNISFTGKRGHSVGFGLFGTLNGVVSDVDFENAFIMANLSGSGFGMVAIRNDGIIQGCSIDEGSAISITDSVFIGGFAGEGSGVVKNCINRASIAGTECEYVGGIIGSSSRIVEECENYGNISSSARWGYAGGISGETNTVVKDCTNYGIVSGSQAGGIVGIASADNPRIIGCENHGAIKGFSVDYSYIGYAGGIVCSGGTIERCANYGDITCAVGAAGISIAGSKIYNCVNYGNVSGQSEDGVGGISWGQCQAYNCANFGVLTAKCQSGIQHVISTNLGPNMKTVIDSCLNATNEILTYPIVYSGVDSTLANNYTLKGECYPPESYLCNVQDLNSKEFYTNVLGWSEDVWDFSELDFENGKYPKLK